jgi:hypothetical protein
MAEGQDGLGRPERELLDDAVAPCPRERVRLCVARRPRLEEINHIKGLGIPGSGGRDERARERAGPQPGRDAPGVLLGPKRVEDERATPRGIVDRSVGRLESLERQPVLRQRAGLVGHDQVDRAEGFLRVQPAHEDSPPQ